MGACHQLRQATHPITGHSNERMKNKQKQQKKKGGGGGGGRYTWKSASSAVHRSTNALFLRPAMRLTKKLGGGEGKYKHNNLLDRRVKSRPVIIESFDWIYQSLVGKRRFEIGNERAIVLVESLRISQAGVAEHSTANSMRNCIQNEGGKLGAALEECAAGGRT